MFYITKLRSGVARISIEKPEGNAFYVEREELPSGDGVLRFGNNNNLYFEGFRSPREEIEEPVVEPEPEVIP